jgi:hypothetical protein
MNPYVRNRVYAFLCFLAAATSYVRVGGFWGIVGLCFFAAVGVACLTAGYVLTYGKQK